MLYRLFFWYNIVGDIMEIIVGKYSGFCAGVKYTIDKAKEIINNNDKVYCLGEIVHNEEVIKELESKGMITVYDIHDIPDGAKVIFRAHGESAKVYEEAKKKNLEIFDLTCGKIKIIHDNISKVLDKFIIIIGKKDHPEIIGTYGFTHDAYIISDTSDIDECYKAYLKQDKKDIYIISQTTYSSIKFDEIVKMIKKKFKADVTVNKSICNATEKRQEEVIEIAKKVAYMLIIGGKNSSNTKELYNLAKQYCDNVFLYQTVDDINESFPRNAKIGIMAGASTPDTVVDKIIKYINY